jgi:hypothetical protein
MGNSEQSSAYAYCNRDRHLVFEELKDDASAKHFLHGTLADKSAQHETEKHKQKRLFTRML